jgi:hypothetical protein
MNNINNNNEKIFIKDSKSQFMGKEMYINLN